MMNFRAGKASLVEILSNAERGRYETIGKQRQVKAAVTFKGDKRYVQVYYSSGNFEESSGRRNGPVQHFVSYKIELSVSSSAKADISKLNDTTATAKDKEAALSAITEASEEADNSIDELIDIVYQILMDGRNIDLGLPVGTFTNRWINNVNKDEPVPRGLYVVLTASMMLSAKTAEQVPGDVGEDGTTNDTVLELDGDTAAQGVTEVT